MSWLLLSVACTLITDAEVADKLGSSDTDSAASDSSDADSANADSADTGIEPGFVTIPPGTFAMGCPAEQLGCDADELEHSVTLSRSYLVGATEVTRTESWTKMGYDPSYFSGCGGACSVEQVSWHEAAAYANSVSLSAGVAQCYSCTGSTADVLCEVAVHPYDCDGYRLLTEAEWEGAARCGDDSLYAGADTINDVGWVLENAGDGPHAVASLAPNGCGLYDMSGNVWEWTQDWYDLYYADQMTDPVGPAEGASRAARGGGWNVAAPDAEVSHRSHSDPAAAYSFVGFRVARSAP